MDAILERSTTWSYYVFFPMMKELRTARGFKSMLRESGLVAYWEAYGWPDFCRPIGGNDFECD